MKHLFGETANVQVLWVNARVVSFASGSDLFGVFVNDIEKNNNTSSCDGRLGTPQEYLS